MSEVRQSQASSGGGGAASFLTITGAPYDNTALAAIFENAQPITRAALIALGANAVVQTTYKVTDAAHTQNPNANPVYVKIEPSYDFTNLKGFIIIPNSFASVNIPCNIEYNLSANVITYLREQGFNNTAYCEAIPTTITSNCVQTFIALIESDAYTQGNNYSNTANDCVITVNDWDTCVINQSTFAPRSTSALTDGFISFN